MTHMTISSATNPSVVHTLAPSITFNPEPRCLQQLGHRVDPPLRLLHCPPSLMPSLPMIHPSSKHPNLRALPSITLLPTSPSFLKIVMTNPCHQSLPLRSLRPPTPLRHRMPSQVTVPTLRLPSLTPSYLPTQRSPSHHRISPSSITIRQTSHLCHHLLLQHLASAERPSTPFAFTKYLVAVSSATNNMSLTPPTHNSSILARSRLPLAPSPQSPTHLGENLYAVAVNISTRSTSTSCLVTVWV